MRTFDAPNDDAFISPVRLTKDPRKVYPFRQDLTAILYLEDYVQRAEYFLPLSLDTPHFNIPTAYLVDESNPSVRSDGLFRWTRTFSTIPATRTEFEKSGFNFPAYQTLSASTTTLRPNFTQGVVAKVVYSYVKTTDPGTDLTITDQFQPLDASSNKVNFVASDSSPTKAAYETDVTAGTYIQAKETEIMRWMGNIWQERNVQVKAL
tara:strand:- start:1491 stop:2111 length:621 start_codon:yes stop_codon:yes gene_type:complete